MPKEQRNEKGKPLTQGSRCCAGGPGVGWGCPDAGRVGSVEKCE